jgi:hypothetical protein
MALRRKDCYLSKSLFFIPTHRDCSSHINQYAQEAFFADNHQSEGATLAIIEHGLPAEVTEAHRVALTAAADTYPVRTLLFSERQKELFVERILRIAYDETDNDECERLRRLLLPSGRSYGAGPNVAYLLSAALSCDVVHRRDSDVYLDKSRLDHLPVELELAGIGCMVDQVSVPVRDEEGAPIRSFPSDPAVVVGTSTFGAPTFDRRDLFAAGSEFIVRFQSLGRPGVPLQEVEAEAMGYLVNESNTRYDEDFFILDDSGRVEMESCCLTEVISYMPEMPTDILGCDYMAKDIAWQTAQPILYHSRKMEHVFDGSRLQMTDQKELCAYALRDLRYIQMGRVWRVNNQRIRDDVLRFFDGSQFYEAEYALNFRSAASQARKTLQAVREGALLIYADAAKAVKSHGARERLVAVANAIQEEGHDFDEVVVNAIDDFTFLVEKWKMLRSAALESGFDFTSVTV